MSQFSIRPFPAVSWALALLVFAVPATAWAQINLSGRAVGGIVVDADGAVRQPTANDRKELLDFLRRQPEQIAPELKLNTNFRKVSLRALQKALADAVNNPEELPDAVRYLAGLQRVQYILVYPEQNDIVLAGPGEGWRFDEEGNAVGVTTGLPVVRLDHLLVALRTVENARTEGISVSIDPTAEGRLRFDQLIKSQRVFSPAVLPAAAQALGPQQVTLTGVPPDSHFAHVLFAADYRMKRLAMNLEKAPIPGLPGYLDLLKSRKQLPGSAIPRWWLACNYEPLARSDDRLAWEIRGQGVKAMTEDEIVAADGTVQGTGREDPTAKQWADLLTQHYTPLSAKDPTLAQLRNLMDLCVVAAVIQREDLVGLAGGNGFPLLARPDSTFAVAQLPAPKTLEPQCSFVRIGRNYVITASGGVLIESWQVASNHEVSPQLKAVHAEGSPRTEQTWWWN